MERIKDNYMVVVDTQRLPESFRGPILLRIIFSRLSRTRNAYIGGTSEKTSLEEAEKIAKEETNPRFTDGYGNLRSQVGKVVRIIDWNG